MSRTAVPSAFSESKISVRPNIVRHIVTPWRRSSHGSAATMAVRTAVATMLHINSAFQSTPSSTRAPVYFLRLLR